MFMLDTNVLIGLQKGSRDILERLTELQDDEFAISSIVELEFRAGLEGLPGDSLDYQFGIAILDRIRVYPFDSAAAQYAARLRASAKIARKFDTLVAAHALSLGKVLVTNDRKGFAGVPGLKLDNWSK